MSFGGLVVAVRPPPLSSPDAGEDQRRGIELLELLERLELLEQDSEDIDRGDIFNFAN